MRILGFLSAVLIFCAAYDVLFDNHEGEKNLIEELSL